MGNGDRDSTLERVREYAERHSLLPRGSHVLAAVSGGQDSSAMLHILWRLRDEFGFRFTAAHLNHGLRGEEAERDADHVLAMTRQLGIECVVETVDVRDAARRSRRGLQETARIVRHRFLDRTAERVAADRVALAHTEDDRVETVLLNILRGTGTDGLAGMRPASAPRIRPLLCLTREDTARYCADHGIAIRPDPTNQSLKYARNRVRLELLPNLAAYYNPGIRKALLRLSEVAAAECAFLESAANDDLARAIESREPDRISLWRDRIAALDPAIRRRAIRAAILEVRGDLLDLDFEFFDRVEKWVVTPSSARRSRQLPLAGVTLSVDRGHIVIATTAAPSSALRYAEPVSVPGQTCVRGACITLIAEVGPPPAELPHDPTSECVVLDFGAIRPPLVLRNRRPGDRMRPVGSPGTRKVQDILVDRKVPEAARDRVPIVADSEGPIWVAGVTFAERVRVTAQTREALTLTVTHSSGRTLENACESTD